jgi:hypothetical protein
MFENQAAQQPLNSQQQLVKLGPQQETRLVEIPVQMTTGGSNPGELISVSDTDGIQYVILPSNHHQQQQQQQHHHQEIHIMTTPTQVIYQRMK